MHSMMHNNQPDGGIGGYDLDIAPPPPPWRSYGGDPAGGWLLPSVGSYANKTCRDALGPQGDCQSPSDCEACTAYQLPNQDWLYNSVNQFSAACWHFAEHCPGPPGRLSALCVFLCKSVFYGVFVWARRALNSQKWRFPARAAR